MPLSPKRYIAGLKSCPHGGLDYPELRSLGISPDAVLDFSVCVNPFMPPPGIKELMKDIPVERYPDSQATALRQGLAAKLGLAPENILAGSGTTELIRLVALAYFRRGDTVFISGPTYGEYEAACRLAGARVLPYRAREEDDFSPDIKEVAEIIRRRPPRAVFICNPGNPTGKYLSRREIESVLGCLKDGLLVLDEAYVAFVRKAWSSLDLIKNNNVLILRSMTKDYGLPGLRLGYGVAPRHIIGSLQALLPPWNVNIVAQEIGTAVLQDDAYLNQTLRKINEAKQYLVRGFSRLGFKVLPSDAHYFLVKVGDAPACRRALLRRGVLVRDCASFGLPGYIRVSPRAIPECKKLIGTIKGLLTSGLLNTKA